MKHFYLLMFLILWGASSSLAQNMMEGWAGKNLETDKPDDYGWACTDPSVTWSTASNSNDIYAYRYRDNLSEVGRVITHPLNNAVFYFPVQLTGGKIYEFSCMNSNMNGSPKTNLGINTKADFTGDTLAIKTVTSPKWPSKTTVSFMFRVPTTGTYYFVWQTINGHDRNFLGSLSITEAGNVATVTFDTQGGNEVQSQYFTEGDSYTITIPASPSKSGYEFAGWFADAAFTQPYDFSMPVTESTTIYARFVSAENPTYTDLNVDGKTMTLTAAPYTRITLSGQSELHLTDSIPLKGSTVTLQGDDAWLFLEGVRVSDLLDKYKESILVGTRPLDPDIDRLSIYGSGTVVIPNGMKWEKNALTVYNDGGLQGSSMSMEPYKYYRSDELGDLDNHIRSFRLRRGYACTLANNPDGTGFSRFFVASDSDLVIDSMPEGLEFASFVRVFRWQWIGKKGICNGSLADITKSSWFYDWSAGGQSTDNYEFVPMRHNLGWDSFALINAKTNVTHVLGYNEPDHTDQSNCTPEQAIAQWPELTKSGLRLGSPAPDAIRKDWLKRFLELADSLNYRVDFVATHMYWNSQTGQGLYDGIVDACTRLYGNRPMWITEMNNGANWTTESWPTPSGPQCDADCNPIVDAEGNTKTVTRPLSKENAEKQLAWMKDVLDGLQRCPYLERHAIYNWVQDARAVVLGGKLTPSGKYFAQFNSAPGFTKAREYVHTWHIAPPLPSLKQTDDYKALVLSWYDHNGETATNYLVERKYTDEEDFQVIKTLVQGTDYEAGETVTFTDSLKGKSAQYRVRATSYKNTLSIYSRILSFNLDTPAEQPQPVKGEGISSRIIQLSWEPVANARAYNLKRASAPDGPYELIGSLLTTTAYTDTALTPDHVYYYTLSAVNNSGESAYTTPTAVSTLALTQPRTPENAYVSSGDNRATLTWDFQYDALYRISRSNEGNGSYEVIADQIDGTRYVDTGVSNGNTYYYIVTAFNDAGSADTPELKASPVYGQWAYWSMDEQGDTIRDAWGGYHGVRSNMAMSAEGKINDGTSFSAADKGYVQLGSDVITNLHDFTMAFWVKLETKGARIFDFGESTSSFMMLSPALRYKITCAKGTYDKTPSNVTLPTGEWTHVALTQKDSVFCMYINGEQVFCDSTAHVHPEDLGANSLNYLVRSRWSADAYSSMTLDEMYLFNTALTANELTKIASGSYDNTVTDITQESMPEVSVFVKGDALYVSSPKSERICVYDVTGKMLFSDVKPAGTAIVHLARPLRGITIVHGATGWSRKLAGR